MCQFTPLLWNAWRWREVAIPPSQRRLPYRLLVERAWGHKLCHQLFLLLQNFCLGMLTTLWLLSLSMILIYMFKTRKWNGSIYLGAISIPLFQILLHILQGLLFFLWVCKSFLLIFFLHPLVNICTQENFCDHSFMYWNMRSAKTHIISPSCTPSPRDVACGNKDHQIRTNVDYSSLLLYSKGVAHHHLHFSETQKQLGEQESFVGENREGSGVHTLIARGRGTWTNKKWCI